MESTSSRKQLKKKENNVWQKIKSGVSNVSKAIVRTPAQDRLARLQNKLAEDQKKFGPNIRAQLNNCVFAKPSTLRGSSIKADRKKDASLSKELAQTKHSVGSTSPALCKRIISESDVRDVLSLINSTETSTPATVSSTYSVARNDKEECPSTSKATRQAVPKIKKRCNQDQPDPKTLNHKDNSLSTAALLSNLEDLKQLPTIQTKIHKRKLSLLESNVPAKLVKTSPEEKLTYIEKKSVKSSLANDRLNRLRSSLQKQVIRKKTEFKANSSNYRMDVDEEMPMASPAVNWEPSTSSSLLSGVTSFFKTLRDDIKNAFDNFIDIKENYSNAINGIQSDAKCVKECIYVVPDTNVFIDHLTFIKDIVDNDRGNNSRTKIYVPYVVIEELDKLKEQKDRSVSTLAMRAIKYLNEKLEKRDEAIKGQTVVESMEKTIPTKFGDDSILNCCLQLRQKGFRFILLSNDVNLRNKALINGVKALASADVDLRDISKYL